MTNPMIPPCDEDAEGPRARPGFLSQASLRDIHVRLAVMGEKLDRLLEDRKTLEEHDDRLTSLEHFQARSQTWAQVAGAIFSIALAAIGAGVFWH